MRFFLSTFQAASQTPSRLHLVGEIASPSCTRIPLKQKLFRKRRPSRRTEINFKKKQFHPSRSPRPPRYPPPSPAQTKIFLKSRSYFCFGPPHRLSLSHSLSVIYLFVYLFIYLFDKCDVDKLLSFRTVRIYILAFTRTYIHFVRNTFANGRKSA